MKKLFFTIFGVYLTMFCLNSCRNDQQNIIQPEAEKYLLNETSLKSLSPFSINFKVTQIDIDKINENDFILIQHIKNGKYGKSELKETTFLTIENSKVTLKTNFFSNEYSIVKDLKANTLIFKKNNISANVTESLINNLNENDGYALKRLLALYIELYDNTQKKLGFSETQASTARLACAQFESSIGFTGSAAAYRAGYDAQMYIMDGHSDCKMIGVDVSCVTDRHVCLATVTMACNGATCN